MYNLQAEIKIKVSKEPTKEIDLKDFIWEQEEFKFEPKENRHRKFLHSKKRQLEKERQANIKKPKIDVILEEHQRYNSKMERSILQDWYDSEEDDFVQYRLK